MMLALLWQAIVAYLALVFTVAVFVGLLLLCVVGLFAVSRVLDGVDRMIADRNRGV